MENLSGMGADSPRVEGSGWVPQALAPKSPLPVPFPRQKIGNDRALPNAIQPEMRHLCCSGFSPPVKITEEAAWRADGRPTQFLRSPKRNPEKGKNTWEA